MKWKILSGVVVVLVAFLGFVASRPSHFRYERSGVVQAPAAKLFPYLEDPKKCEEWNPFTKKDPNIKITFSGPPSGVGARMAFEGNSEVGAGSLEVLKVVPNEAVDVRLSMTSPMHAEHLVQYRLSPEGTGTKFVWSLEGENGFLGKLMGVFIDCDKMVGDDFAKGIANLKSVVEKEGATL